MKYLQILIALTLSLNLFGQVTIEPAFPTINDEITITFNASQGDKGLENFDGDVYAHTGLITDQSNEWQYVPVDWGIADDKVKLTRASANTYELQMTIKDFYNVPDGVVITKIAFVFRNADGSASGRAPGGADIFYDVFESSEAFLLTIQEPVGKIVSAEIGTALPFKAETSKEATFTVLEDSDTLFTSVGTTVDSSLMPKTGYHLITIKAEFEDQSDSVQFAYIVIDENTRVDSMPPQGNEAGIFYTSDTSVLLQFYAKDKSSVFLLGDFNNWFPDTELFRSPNGEIFWTEVTGLTAGESYGFQYLVDGDILVADPHSALILDPFNDGSISEDIYPNMPAYPTGKTAQLVGVLQPGATPFQWQHDAVEMPDQEELIIYELMLRDFFDEPSYQALIDTMSYFERLGVNAIQLMPVSEFEGNNSWGYNPSFHMALDKYYGDAETFKRFVDFAHSKGIAVILDVVYNHVFGQGTLARLYWDSENNRPAANSPYANPIAKHPFNVGLDLNHQSKPLTDYVKKSLAFWQEEYKIDGFRFDLSKGFTQIESTNNDVFAALDQDRVDVIRSYYDTIKAIDSDAYVILEHFGSVEEERILANFGCMLWNNQNHAFSNLAKGTTANLTGMDPKPRGMNDYHLISYMESHDEERQMVRILNEGRANGAYNTRDLATALQRVEMSSVLFYTFPGPKMIWQFGEFGYDLSINRCTDGSISDNCRLADKPTRWDYFVDADRRRVFDLVAKMNELRAEHPIFNTDSVVYQLDGNGKYISLISDSISIMAVANPDLNTKVVPAGFPQTGTWHRYFENDSVTIDASVTSLTLPAGGYELFSTQKLREENELVFTNTDKLAAVVSTIYHYPNPSNGEVTVVVALEQGLDYQLDVFNGLGQIVATQPIKGQAGENETTLNLNALSTGIYYMRLNSSLGQMTQKISIVK